MELKFFTKNKPNRIFLQPLPRTLQHVLQEARLEDLRTLWDLSLFSSWHVISQRTEPILIVKEEEEEKEQKWAKLEKLWTPSQLVEPVGDSRS